MHVNPFKKNHNLYRKTVNFKLNVLFKKVSFAGSARSLVLNVSDELQEQLF